MVTVFDVATREELMEMFSIEGEDITEEDIKDLRKYRNPDSNNAELARLYAGRGNMEKAEEYLALIKNDQYRMATALSIYEETD